MKTDVHLWHLAKFIFELEMFQTNVQKNKNTHFMFSKGKGYPQQAEGFRVS